MRADRGHAGLSCVDVSDASQPVVRADLSRESPAIAILWWCDGRCALHVAPEPSEMSSVTYQTSCGPSFGSGQVNGLLQPGAVAIAQCKRSENDGRSHPRRPSRNRSDGARSAQSQCRASVRRGLAISGAVCAAFARASLRLLRMAISHPFPVVAPLAVVPARGSHFSVAGPARPPDRQGLPPKNGLAAGVAL